LGLAIARLGLGRGSRVLRSRQNEHRLDDHPLVDAPFGQIAHVFSTYDARHRRADPEPFVRAINSIQLFHDGTRWWVLTVAWSAETADTPIPDAYLPR
jgi:hypothetical protein